MRKILFTLAFAIILALALTSTASANGGPHGGYTATTDACAGCHRAHTAVGPNLLVQASTWDLCMSCHSNTGSGANTNVRDGLYLTGRNAASVTITANNANLLGGGFTNYKTVAVTSKHDVSTGAAITGSLLAWGNGAATARGTTATIATVADPQFNCASCHDPHGSSNYRIIKTTVNSAAVAVALVDEGAANKDYGVEHWGTGQSNLCSACHSSYHVTQASAGSVDQASKVAGQYGNDTTTWAHRVDMAYFYGANVNPETVGVTEGVTTYTLPLAETGTNNTVACQTCHLPHGSSAAMTGFADGGPTGGGIQPGNTIVTDSALLRLDNRGVCEVCHQK